MSSTFFWSVCTQMLMIFVHMCNFQIGLAVTICLYYLYNVLKMWWCKIFIYCFKRMLRPALKKYWFTAMWPKFLTVGRQAGNQAFFVCWYYMLTMKNKVYTKIFLVSGSLNELVDWLQTNNFYGWPHVILNLLTGSRASWIWNIWNGGSFKVLRRWQS